MLARLLSRRPSHATVVAYLALFLALGGGTTAVALQGRNTVDSGDIINGQVRSADVRNGNLRSVDILDGAIGAIDVAPGSLRGNEIQDGSLSGSDVGDNSLGGADINESSLGSVPAANQAVNANQAINAHQATNADKVNGHRVVTFNFNENAFVGSLTKTVVSQGGLTIRARCAPTSSGDRLNIFVNTDTNNSYVRAHAGIADADFNTGETHQIFSSEDHWGGLIYRRGGVIAQVVSVNWAWDVNPAGNDCQLSGTALGGR